MAVTKLAVRPDSFARPAYAFKQARRGFRAFLDAFRSSGGRGRILLPGYIGFSPREGSGVFDPVRQVGIPFEFYKLTATLGIDLEDLDRKLRRDRPGLVLFIHYFGWPQEGSREAAKKARGAGWTVIEDEAHAFLTDVTSGIVGRLGHACLVSLHKLLPVVEGGLLILSGALGSKMRARLRKSTLRSRLRYDPFAWDFHAIAKRRRDNARLLYSLLDGNRAGIVPLFETLPEGVVPQTLPVLLTRESRDLVYQQMNQAGFGVVSLYHTLIEPLVGADTQAVSHRILNLPVHQDATERELRLLVVRLLSLCSRSI